jgi:hypothetical protein
MAVLDGGIPPSPFSHELKNGDRLAPPQTAARATASLRASRHCRLQSTTCSASVP